jgi:Domain of unknown function (DUF1929)/Bacterial Ig-like domain (group 2)/Glyoxal oxidase N-terminus/Abnormal spindle-like microcephaly-assoc'd, ASPM-SPD-2-Hydin
VHKRFFPTLQQQVLTEVRFMTRLTLNARIPLQVLLALSLALTARAQTLNEGTVAFGNVAVQTTSAAKTVILSNTQTSPLTISGISASGSFAATSTCPLSPLTLAANGTCQIHVTFAPTGLGATSGTLTVSDNGSTSSQTANLTGTGVPIVNVTPASYSFGGEVVGGSSATRNVAITNYQSTPLTISNIAVTGNFTANSSCPVSPNTLAVNTTCTIAVAFAPVSVGALTGSLTATYNASNSPQTVQLTGTGVAPVTFSPATTPFGNQLVNSTSAAKIVTLKNAQAVALTINNITTSGPFAVSATTCPLTPNTLAGGSTCTVSVTFTPIALGAVTGSLIVADSASTSPQSESLSGAGGLPGITTISVTPNTPSLFAGAQVQLTATANFSNGTTMNVTNLLNWSSSVPTFAQVNSTGLVRALAPGESIIVASYTIYSGQATVKVAVPGVSSIVVSPGTSTNPAGAYQQFSAILHFSNGTTSDSTSAVTWSSSSPGTASINSSGLANAATAGSATITATLGSITGNGTMKVTQPACTTVPAGLTDWWTGDGNVVDLAGSNSGTLQNGATYGTGEVGQAFNFPGSGSSVLINSPVYSPLTGTLMFWFNSTGGGALTGGYAGGQSRAPGLLISNGTLYWEFGNLYSQPVAQINPNQWYQAAMTYSTVNSQATVSVYLNGALVAEEIADANTSWNPQVAFGAYMGASNPSFVGSMDEIAVFNRTLTAPQIKTIYNVYSSGMCKPTLQSIAINPANPNLAPGLNLPFDAVGSYSNSTTHDVTTSATWSASPTGFATISSAGLATGVASGTTTVTSALGSVQGSTALNVKPSLVSIQVTPANPKASVGASEAFTATGTFSDGSTQNLTNSVTWTSSSSVASIAANGVATSTGAGQTTITATGGSVTGNTVLTVNSATLLSIAVTPATPSIAAGATQQFTATGTYSDASKQNLTNTATWNSTSSTAATVAAGGLASGVGNGQTSITATVGSVTGTSSLTVNSAVLSAIQISPQSSSLIIGSGQQFTATGVYSNGTTANVTASATWTSSASNVATMSTSTLGLAGSTGTGTTTITASYSGLAASTTLSVQDELLSITVLPATATLVTGQSEQYSALGNYISGVTENLTSNVSWNSSTGSATVASGGLATMVTSGQTSVTATLGSVSGSATLTVGQASVIGQWNTLTNLMPINAIHDALLPNGEVFVVSGSGACAPNVKGCPTAPPYGPTNGGGALLMDPFTGQVLNTFVVPFDMFCNGMAVLQDGTAFIAGGNLQYNPFEGLANASIFNPTTNTFTEQPNMAHGRWYPTVMTLADGTIMTFSGLSETGVTNPAVEFFTEGSGWSTQYIAPFTPDLYPRLHLLPNGLVFYSSATPKSKMFNPSTFTWNTSFASTNWGGSRLYGSSVMLPLSPANGYDPKVMILGGGTPATDTTEIIDLGAATPAWQYGPPMSQPRIEMNAVILPNGNILALGGSLNNEDLSTASLNADLYNPATNTFSSAGANAYPRLYHSAAMLLPDATVWVAGSNPAQNNFEPHIEIYQPPYLFNSNNTLATRPTITSAPSTISWGNTFTVTTPDAANITSVVLIRTASVTHAFGMDLRDVELSFTAGNGSLTVTAPPNGNIAPPGFYLLFILNSAGVPSVAPFVQITTGTSGAVVKAASASLTAAQSDPARFAQGQAPVRIEDIMAGKTHAMVPTEGQGMVMSSEAEMPSVTAADLNGIWSGKFTSNTPNIGSFTIKVEVSEDAHGELSGSTTLTSSCLKNAKLQARINGSEVVFVGSNEAGDNISVRATLEKSGTLESSYILDGSASGACETDSGMGTLTKQ